MSFKYRVLTAFLLSLILAFLQVNPSFSVTSLGPETPEAGLDTTQKEDGHELNDNQIGELQSSNDKHYSTHGKWPEGAFDFNANKYLEFSFPELIIPADASLVSVELRHEYRYTNKKVTGSLQGKYDLFSEETLLGSVVAGIPANSKKDLTDIKELVALLDSVEDLSSLKIRFYLISTAEKGTKTKHDLASLSVVYNKRPNAYNQTPVTDEDTPLAITLTASDPDGDNPIVFSLVDSPENGVVELYPTGEITYTPNQDFNGNDSFTFKVTDALEAESDQATVNIKVNPVNDLPTPPTPLSPSDALETNSPDINFSWGESVDVDLDELIYLIQIGRSESPCDWKDLLVDQEVSGLSYSMADLTDGNYCWRVGVSDGIDHIWSESWIFVVDLPVAISSTISTEAPGNAPQNSITVSWTTDKPADSRVIYDTVSHSFLGAAPNYGYAFSTATFNATDKVVSHSVTIVGLSPNTTYYYRTVSAASPVTVSTEFSFTTAEVEEEEEAQEDDTEKRQESVPQVPSAIAVQESKDRVLSKELVETAEEPKLATVPDKTSVDTSADSTAPWTVWIALLATLGVGVIYIVRRSKTR